MNTWLNDNVWKIAAIITPAIAWFVKGSKLFKSNMLANSLKIYQDMLDDLDIRLGDRGEQIKVLEDKLHEAHLLISRLEDKIDDLNDTVKKLTEKIENL